MAESILSLGTNLGDKQKNLNDALNSIKLLPKTNILKVSKFYETEPFEVPDRQLNYLNCCVKISTDLSAHVLLGACLGIESAMGRIREFKFCSRIIDIDLLIYDHETYNDSDLVLPHPEIKKRMFVMMPLNDICENMKFGNVDFSADIVRI